MHVKGNVAYRTAAAQLNKNHSGTELLNDSPTSLQCSELLQE